VIRIELAGAQPIELAHVILDVNGTLSVHGDLLDGVEERISALKQLVEVRLVSADSFGTLAEIATRLSVEAITAADGVSKLRILEGLGRDRTAHIGNGTNDVSALKAAALGVAVIGPEGLSGAALLAADVVFASINDALDALLDPRRLTATLRS
jgi:P-type E1-E2 ATPase